MFQAIIKKNETSAFIICNPWIPTLGKLFCQNRNYFTCSVLFRWHTKTVLYVTSLSAHGISYRIPSCEINKPTHTLM